MQTKIYLFLGVILSLFAIRSNAQICEAKFTFANSCTTTIQFTNQSSDAFYFWTFGDGTPSSNLRNPSHTFPRVGRFEVCLNIEFGGCVNRACQIIDVGADTEEPVFSNCRTARFTRNTDSGKCEAVVNLSAVPLPTATDNCDRNLTYQLSPASNVFSVGETLVSRIATDDAGNTASCDYVLVVVQDREAPVFNCPPNNFITTLDRGQCYATLTREDLEPSAADNCEVTGVTVTGIPSQNRFPIGITKVTFIARDEAGNRDTCIVNVEVRDDIPPSLICPRDTSITASADSSGATVRFSTPTYADNCSTVTYVCTPKSGTFFPIGTTPVTVKATDAAGNSTTCMYRVTVIKPAPACKADFSVLLNPCGEYTFINQSTGAAPLTYLWTFGDGTTSTLKDPTHTYPTFIPYTLSLKITDANGCTSTAGVSVENPRTVTIDTIPQGDSCCYALDFQLPDGIINLQGAILTTGVTFANLQHNTNGGLDFSSNSNSFSLNSLGVIQQNIPGGFYDNLASFCFNNVTSSPIKIVIRYYKLGPTGSEELICADTLEFNCKPKTCCDQNKVIATQVSGDPCCFKLSIENYCERTFKGVCLQGLNGVDFGSSFTSGTGWVKYTFGPDKIVLDAPGLWIPTGTTIQIGEICLDNFSSIPQEVEVVFLDNNYRPTDCKKKVAVQCPVISNDPRCLIPVKDTVRCEDDTYIYSFTVCNQSVPGFTINYVEIIPVAGFTVTPNVLQIPGGLTAGNCTTIPFTVTVSGPNAIAFNNFCYNLAGHDNDPTSTIDPPTQCCTDTTSYCIKLPKCCDCKEDITAIVLPKGNGIADCCYQVEINNQYCEKITKIVGTLSGSPATFGPITSQPGWAYNLSGGNKIITYNAFPPGDVPTGISQLPVFCLNNYNANQSLILAYYGIENGVEKVICQDTVMLACPPEPLCDSLVNQKLVCLPNGDYQFTFQVFNNSAFTLNTVTLYPSSPAFIIPPITVASTAPGDLTPVITITIPGSQLSGATQFCLKVHIGQVVNGKEIFCCTNPSVVCIPVPDCACKCGKWENFLATLPGQTPVEACGETFSSIFVGQAASVNWNYQCMGADSCDTEYIIQVTRPTTGGSSFSSTYTTKDTSLFVNFTLPGKYCYTITPICNGRKCEPCTVCFEVKPQEDDCGCDGEWLPLGLEDRVDEVSLVVDFNKFIQLECDRPYRVFGDYQCSGDNCAAIYSYTLTGPAGFVSLSASNLTTFSLPLNFTISGTYTLTINVLCGNQICPRVLTFVVKCPPIELCICMRPPPVTVAANGTNIATISCGSQPITMPCPQPGSGYTFTGLMDCSGNVNCGINPNVSWTLTHIPTSSTTNGTNPPNFNIFIASSFLTAPGLYELTVTRFCGGNPCVCKIQFIVPECADSCTCDENSFDLAYAIGRGPITPVVCGDTMPVVCGNVFSFYPGFDCTGPDCPAAPKVDWMLINPNGGTVQSGNSLATLDINPGNSATIFTIPGTYTLTMTGYCGSDTCTCTVYFKVPDCGRDCIDFDHNEMASDWTQFNLNDLEITLVPGNPINPPSDPTGNVLHIKDGSGGSIAVNNIDFAGNWLDIAEDGCLCFDYMIIYNATVPLNGNPTAPKIGIYTGPPITSLAQVQATGFLRATFIGNSNNSAINNGEWDKYCLPLGLCQGGNLPSNQYGTWVISDGITNLSGAAACAAWSNIITNVTGLIIYADYNSQPSEEVYFDNFCWNCSGDSLTKCDSLMVMLDSISTSKDSCCYTVNIKNNIGSSITQVTAEVITPGWSFNTASLKPGAGFNYCSTSNNQTLCITNSTHSIPSGVTNDFLTFCLTQLPGTPLPATTQQVVFSWVQELPNGDSIICRDTIVTHCDPPVKADTCLAFIKPEVNCNPKDSTEFTMTFQVTNNTGYPVSFVNLNSITPGFSFAPCVLGAGGSSITLPLIPTLQNGDPSSPLCVKIISTNPITAPTQVCFRMKMIGLEDCCHSPITYCVTLNPCCNPCENNEVIVEEVIVDSAECCYKLDIINDCDSTYFTKIETEILTPGVLFGYHALGRPQFGLAWQVPVSSNTLITWMPSSGGIPIGTTEDIIQFCLDNINTAAQVPQIVVVRWITRDILGRDSVACTDTLTFNCPPVVDYDCVETVIDSIVCLPDGNKYLVTMTFTNQSSFTADELLLFVTSPSDLSFSPTPIFPLSPVLNPSGSVTITTCIVSSSGFPPTATQLVFEPRLVSNNGDTCCFENTPIILPLPPCDTCTCGKFDFIYSISRQPTQTAVCGDTIGVACGFQFAFGGTFKCEGADCPERPKVDWVLTHPILGNVQSGNNVPSFAFPPGDLSVFPIPGLYTLTMTGYCGKDTCPCVVYFEVPKCDTCCRDSLAFMDKINQGFTVVVDSVNCKVTLTAPQFDSCHWFGSPPILVGGDPVSDVITDPTGSWMFEFDQSGTYEVCVTVYEGHSLDDLCWGGQMCTKFTINCVKPDTCTCDRFAEMGIRINGGRTRTITCNNDPVTLPCNPDAKNISLEILGQLLCKPTSDSCFAKALQWSLRHVPSGMITTGMGNFVGASGNFSFPINLDQCKPGLYEITLTGKCGNDVCKCVLRFIVPEDCCDDCCKDKAQFDALVTQGFQVAIDECKVTVTTTQFDSCHLATVPDFGDGTPQLRPLVPANGMWMHTYTQSGTYIICADVFEQNSNDSICWRGKMCDTVKVDCRPGNCDSLDINIKFDNTQREACCWKGDLNNQYANNINSVDLNVTNAQFANVNVNLPGWSASVSGSTARLYPPSGVFPEGNYLNAFSFCLTNITGTPQIVTIGWNVPNPANPAKDTTICPERFTLDCSAGCGCGQYTNLFFAYERGQKVQATCNGPRIDLDCAPPGYVWGFYGQFACSGNCPAETPINWELFYTSGLTPISVANGSSPASPQFGISLPNSYFTQAGDYEIRLTTTCGNQRCTCVIKIRVKKCPSSNCECNEDEFEQAVAQGYDQLEVFPNDCRACVRPRALTDCDEVVWLLNGRIIGTSVGNQIFCHQFPGSGTYVLTMMVIRHDANGNICMGDCWDNKFEQRITLRCTQGLGTGIEELKINRSFDLHPNPTNNDVTLTFKDWQPPTGTQLHILDIHGKLLFTEPVMEGSPTHLLKLRELPSGIYLIKIIENNNPVGLGRVVKQQ